MLHWRVERWCKWGRRIRLIKPPLTPPPLQPPHLCSSSQTFCPTCYSAAVKLGCTPPCSQPSSLYPPPFLLGQRLCEEVHYRRGCGPTQVRLGSVPTIGPALLLYPAPPPLSGPHWLPWKRETRHKKVLLALPIKSAFPSRSTTLQLPDTGDAIRLWPCPSSSPLTPNPPSQTHSPSPSCYSSSESPVLGG